VSTSCCRQWACPHLEEPGPSSVRTPTFDRPLDGEWPYRWLDATYRKVRDGGRIVLVAAIIAVAVSTEGRRAIAGLGRC
jgi:hypothetical protein